MKMSLFVIGIKPRAALFNGEPRKVWEVTFSNNPPPMIPAPSSKVEHDTQVIVDAQLRLIVDKPIDFRFGDYVTVILENKE